MTAKGGGQGRWFRVYDALVDDPKVQRLPAETFRGLINLWCLASQNDGLIPPIPDIAFKLRMTEPKAAALLESLAVAGLLDRDETGTRPHNWDGRQYKSDVSTPRVKLFRERKRNGRRNVSPPLPETAPDTETDIPKPNGSGRDDVSPPTAEAELFDRGKKVLGPSSGGMIRNLLKAKGGNIALARAAIEQASTKQNPREFVGRIVSGTPPAGHAGAVQTVAL